MADMVMETPTATSRRFRNAGLWALQIAGAAMFFMAGTSKLMGAESMIQVFAAVGLGQCCGTLRGPSKCWVRPRYWFRILPAWRRYGSRP